MNHLVSHLVKQHLELIAAKSFLHCHVKGIHSIMLIDSPEQRVRLFIATPQHELYKNTTETLGSLAAHAHHCDVTLHCVFGVFTNLEYTPYKAGPESGGPYHAYRYVSGILNDKGSFSASDAPGVALSYVRSVGAGESITLPAKQVHSIHVEQGVRAAWFVYEGREDHSYESLSYSDQPLSQASFDGLYVPMNTNQVVGLLQSVSLL